MSKKRQMKPKNVWKNVRKIQDDDLNKIWKDIQSIRRNDPCWCDSGVKYKQCHLNRSQEAPLRIYEYIKVLRKIYDKGHCLHPQADPTVCIGPIVKAHSVQRGGGLSRIARNGHVYTFSSEKNLSSADLVAPTLVGIHKASTFTGFCSFHDNATFAPVEKNPFEHTLEHTFLLGYRAICHEYFKKKMIVELILPYQQRHLDKGRPQSEQLMIQYHVHYLRKSDGIGLRDLALYKAEYDRTLLAGDISKVSYYVIRFSNTPDFLCCSPHMPDYDFTGRRTLQNIWDTSITGDHLTYSLIATDTGGAAVFSWLGKSEAAEQFVQSLDSLPDHEIPHAIARFTFQYFENIFVSPTWWDGLDESSQQSLLNRQRAGIPHLPRPTAACLVDDGVRAANWTVSLRKTNLVF